MKKTFFLLLMVLLSLLFMNAQSNAKIAIVDYIESNSKTRIHHEGSVNKILKLFLDESTVVNSEKEERNKEIVYTGAGYRVQVFSSNEQRTAKNRAQQIEKSLRFAFPSHGVYRVYSSPFWKVRIGDFRTQAEAREFMQSVKASFPEYSRETYVVRDTNVSVKK